MSHSEKIMLKKIGQNAYDIRVKILIESRLSVDQRIRLTDMLYSLFTIL